MFWLPMQVTGSRLSESTARPMTMRLEALASALSASAAPVPFSA